MNGNPPADPPWLEEAIEAVAQVMYNGANPNGVDWWNAGTLTTDSKRLWRVKAAAALRAALPLIAAGVLRDAAHDLSLSGADQDTARWLRERAAGES